MAFSTINKSTSFQNNVSYTGDGSTQAITGVGFQPDFIWLKSTGTTYNYQTFNPLIGTDYSITTNENAAKISMSGVTAFGADGFTLGTNSQCNNNTTPYISWNWKAGTTSGIAGSPSITPTSYSFNATSGFSIIKWTANSTGLNTDTLPHGLGVAPSMIIIKCTSDADSWIVYTKTLGAGKQLFLNATDGEQTNANKYPTTPTSTLFYPGSDSSTNSSSRSYIAYCFADVPGFSQCSGYTGNGSANGTFVYTGFSPNWVMIKETSGAGGWRVFDNLRPPFNSKYGLAVDSDAAQETATARNKIDQLSNGFKLRYQYDDTNGSGSSYIYLAIGQPIISNSGGVANAR